MIADSAFGWTLVSTQADAGVAAVQGLGTGLGARWAIARLVAKFTASLMRTLPGAGLNTWSTGLPTWPHTLTVDAAVLARSLTGGAVTSARLPALVRANQETFTLVQTWEMEASLITLSTVTAAGMATFQLMLTWALTLRLFYLCSVKAGIFLAVAAPQPQGDLHPALNGARFPAG